MSEENAPSPPACPRPRRASKLKWGEKPARLAVIYLRVSTDQQAESGLGMAAQEAACREWCSGRGLEVVGVFRDDGKSGMLEPAHRPGVVAALRALDAHRFDGDAVLVVYSLSRFCRKMRDLWGLVDNPARPVPLCSVTEPFDMSTTSGRAFAGMLSVMGQMEADLARDRTKAALAAKVMRGDPSRRAESVCGEALVVALELRERGATQRQVVAELNRRGIASPMGRRWHLPMVQRMLARARRVAPREEVIRIWLAEGRSMERTAERLGIDVAEFQRWLTVDPGLRRALAG